MELLKAIYTQSYFTVTTGVFSKARTLYCRHCKSIMSLPSLLFLSIQIPTEKAPGSIFRDTYMQANWPSKPNRWQGLVVGPTGLCRHCRLCGNHARLY